MTKVAVVSAVYNVENYLVRCLDSLVNQTLKDIAIILVNDGSTDNSLKIAKEYADKDNRIKVIDKANTGYGDSMNVGIKFAIENGAEYIAFMDPDDYIALDGYEKLYALAKKHNVDVLRANITSVVINSEGQQEYFENNSLRQFPEYYNKVLRVAENKNVFTMNSNCGGLFSAKFIKENNILHNATPGASFQDIGFWFQSYTLANRLYFSPNRYYFYQRERQGSSAEGKKDIETIFKEYEYIKKFMDLHDDIKKTFSKEYYIAMYRSIYWYFHLIKDECKKAFVLKSSNIFRNAINNNEIDIETIKRTSEFFEMIVNNPTEFLDVMKKEISIKSTVLVFPR